MKISGIVLGVLLGLFVPCFGDRYIDCPLVWIGINSGEPYPEHFVPATTYGLDYLIARLGTSKPRVGYVANGTCFAYDGNPELLPTKDKSFEVLTNPNGCTLNWIEGSWANWEEAEHLVSAYANSESKVGRAMSSLEIRILGGEVKSAEQIYVALNNQTGTALPEFEILQSYQQGLRLQINSFTLENGNALKAEPRVLGIDQIVNRSPGTVSQQVVHKSEQESSTSFTTDSESTGSSWGHVESITCEVENKFQFNGEDVDDGTISVDFGEFEFPSLEYPFEDPESRLVDESEMSVEANIKVHVLPFTSIQLCSTTEVIEEFQLRYWAVGRYSAPGLTGSEILAILAKDKIVGTIEESSVLVNVTGLFSGSSFSATQFLSAPLDRTGAGSCYDLSEQIAAFRRDKSAGLFKDDQDRKSRLEQIRQSMASMTILN